MKSAALLLLLLASCASAQQRRGDEPGQDLSLAYMAALEHVRTHYSGTTPARILLSDLIYRPEPPVQPGDRHSPEATQLFRRRGLIEAVCEAVQCRTDGRYVVVKLGPVLPLPGGRVKVVGEPVQGVPLADALEAIPDSAAVPADVYLHVSITTPCAYSECEPTLESFRYFLRVQPQGGYSVVTRWLWGRV
jgi:hypothetical protein